MYEDKLDKLLNTALFIPRTFMQEQELGQKALAGMQKDLITRFNSDNLRKEAALPGRASGGYIQMGCETLSPLYPVSPGVSWSQFSVVLERSLSHFQDASRQAGWEARTGYGGTVLTQKVLGSTIRQTLLSHSHIQAWRTAAWLPLSRN